MMRALAALAMILTCFLTGASAEEQSCTGKACLNIGHHDEVSMLQVNISKHISRQGAPNDAAWQKSALDEHNKLRAKHGAPPLSWCDSCALDAKKAADSSSRKNVLEHTNHDGQGQNAAMAKPARGADKATDDWYSEITDYNFQAGSGPGTGHFTQVVWCGSQKVGCAASQDGVYVFCNYVPAGNYMGEYVANVPKVGGKCGSSNSAPAQRQQPSQSSRSSGRPSQSSRSSVRPSGSSGRQQSSQPSGPTCVDKTKECEAKPGCYLASCSSSNGVATASDCKCKPQQQSRPQSKPSSSSRVVSPSRSSPSSSSSSSFTTCRQYLSWCSSQNCNKKSCSSSTSSSGKATVSGSCCGKTP